MMIRRLGFSLLLLAFAIQSVSALCSTHLTAQPCYADEACSWDWAATGNATKCVAHLGCGGDKPQVVCEAAENLNRCQFDFFSNDCVDGPRCLTLYTTQEACDAAPQADYCHWNADHAFCFAGPTGPGTSSSAHNKPSNADMTLLIVTLATFLVNAVLFGSVSILTK